MRFAETAFAIRLVDTGHLIAEFPEVVVVHVDTDSIGELWEAMALGRLGQCRFCDAEPELARRYFSGPAPWEGPTTISPALARSALGAACRRLCRGDLRSARTQFRLAWRGLFAVMFGWRGQTLATSLRAVRSLVDMLVKLHVTRRPERSGDWTPVIESYRRLRTSCAEIGSIRYLSARQAVEPTTMSIDSVAADCIGFFPSETWRGETYRWSEPIAALGLRLPADSCRIHLDARPTGGWLVRKPTLYFGGRRLASSAVSEEDGIVTIAISANLLRGGGWRMLSWECEPFVPASHGLPDPRRLGVAIIGARIEHAAGATATILDRGVAA